MNYKRSTVFILVAVLLVSSLAVVPALAAEDEGELVKEINLEVRTKETTGIADTAKGTLDLFMDPTAGSKFEGISKSMQQNLGRIKSAGGYNNLTFNPAATAKYTCEVGGQRRFNPYSIEKFRYAMNWLVNRKKIVEEIYNGYAAVRPTSLAKGVSTYDEYVQPIVSERGITPSGDFSKAKKMITDALEKAMKDPELKGELKKMEAEDAPAGYWWAYKGPNEDKFSKIRPEIIIRIEDKRKQIGQYYADQLEKVGIDPKRNLWERSKAMQAWLYSDPKDLKWHVYTGGWGASGNSYFNIYSAFQMYSPFYGFMAGGFAGETAWKYKNAKLDKYGLKIINGELETKEDYWQTFQKCLDLGVGESVRVFLTTTFEYYAYNNSKVTSFVPDAKIGWSSIWTGRTIKTKSGVFETAEYSSQGALFMSNWNRINGSTDTYSVRLLRLMRDPASWSDPQTGLSRPIRSPWTIQKDYKYVETEDGGKKLQPNLEVPDDAVYYDTKEEKWKKVDEDTKAATSATYQYKFSKFHDGTMMDDSDLIAQWGFQKEWAYEDGDKDPKYNSGWGGQTKPWFEKIKGVVWKGDGKFTVYGDYTFPSDPMIGSYYSISPYKPWEINYAVGELVASTEPSPVLETSYSWGETEGAKWVHFISKNQGKDFKAKLQSMKENFNIPPYLKVENNSPFPVKSSEFNNRVDNAIAFYNEYGHFYPTQGPFVLTNFDAQNMVMNFKRFDQVVEDPKYPFAWDHWSETLKFVKLTLGNIQAPSTASVGSSFDVSINAERTQSYPTEETAPAEKGDVEVRLIKDGDIVFKTAAKLSEAGTFSATIPKSATEELSAGAYTLKVVGSLPEQAASAEEATASIVLT